MSNGELVVRTEADDFLPAITLGQMRQRKEAIRKFIAEEMVPGEDFGPIPGTNGKDVLLKPGAEKLIRLFTYTASFSEVKVVEDWTGKDHDGEPFLFYKIKCSIHKDGRFMGDADGSCNSWEKKYRYTKKQRICPSCGQETIFPQKDKPGFFCWKNKGGCGRQFAGGTPEFVALQSQDAGQVPDPDVADKANTIMKMAEKRALTAACLIVVGASEFFTQDVETERPAQSAPQVAPARPAPPQRHNEQVYEAEYLPQEPRHYESSGEQRMEIEAAQRLHRQAAEQMHAEAATTINKAQASAQLKEILSDGGYEPPTPAEYRRIMRIFFPDVESDQLTTKHFLDAAALPLDAIATAIKQMYIPEAAGNPHNAVIDAATMYQSPNPALPLTSEAAKIREQLRDKESLNNVA